MAPSNMFSYLRPGHAKRTAAHEQQQQQQQQQTQHLHNAALLSPSSAPPLPSPAPSSVYTLAPEYPSATSPPSSASAAAASSPISPFPPQLPPIARVASKLDRSSTPATTSPAPPAATASPALDSKPTFTRAYTDVTPSTGRRPQGLGIQHKTEHPAAAEHQPAPSALSPSYAAHSRSQSSLMGGLSDKLAGSSRQPAQPGPVPSKSKSRLNLRNPMSLLMRRRSGQTLDPLHDESLVTQRSPSFVPPMRDNYDPSIRGSIVHDFNAPRLNRNFSYTNAYGGTQETPGTPSTPADLDRVSPPKIEKEHTPIFHEHFDDDTSYEQSQAAVRAEQLANNDFVARNSALFLPSDHSPPEPAPAPAPIHTSAPAPAPAPAPAQEPSPKEMLPEPSSQSLPHPPPPYQAVDLTSSVLSPVEEMPSPTYVPNEEAPKKRKSTKSPPPARSRATSLTDPSWQPAGLPAHLSSRASRFSFQISGSSDSTQEKIMEERHRQKAAEKASKQVRMSTNTLDDEYDEYGMDDDFDMDGGYEEEIPMIGEEDEFTGLGNQSIQDGVSAFDFSTLSINPGATGAMGPIGSVQAPYDVNGNVIGYAMSGNANQPVQPPAYNATSSIPQENAAPKEQNFDDFDMDDDMYFDDGLIGEQDFGDATEFNEDVFDDPNGPLYERKTKPPPAVNEPSGPSSHPLETMPSETGYEADDDTLARNLEKSAPSLAHKTSVAHPKNMPSFPNMDSYHSALVDAANRAEAEGRFARTSSTDVGQSSSDLEDSSSYSNSRPSLVPENTDFNSGMSGYPVDDDGFGMDSSFMDDYDYSEYDSNLEDDPMIAAANAEALAYDDEGFYGSEFGFYASGAGDGQNSWGGVFGSSGVGRTISGRNAVREPNLTPITERSEYSTRNSFISIHHFRDGTMPLASPMGQLASPMGQLASPIGQLTSPGLAQLARMSPYGFPGEDDDMRFEALLRLRKGAFGGSASSLPGSAANSPRTSSPMGMQFAPRTPGVSGRRLHEHSESAVESDESANPASSPDENEQRNRSMDAVNTAFENGNKSSSPGDERPESPILSPSDHQPLASPAANTTANTTANAPASPKPTRPQILQNKYMQVPSNLGPLSPAGLPLKSPSNIALPMSPFAMPLPSPFNAQHPASPPPIDTSLSSPAATSSTGPRRQSLGFASPISTSSPMTPNGSGWRGGHSRKGSAADSVTYVREHDEAGEGRWVLERRRTAESGELELIGREIVEGGRI